MTDRWHALEGDALLTRHGVSLADGLSEAEAAERLRQHGPNLPPQPRGRTWLARLLDQLLQPLVLILLLSGAITALLGEWLDAGVIFGVVAVNALVGLVQEGKAEQALAALAQAIAARATVVRGGRRYQLDAATLVPGDVVWLGSGDKVPADLRLISGKELRTMEAALTGESLPVAKSPSTIAADTPLADRCNMLYAGTHVVAGQGHALVVATGGSTETGRIAGLIAAAPAVETPLTRKMAAFSQQLLWIILLLAALTFTIGMLRGESAFAMFMAAVALAVGAIPEGLPAAVTVTLAIGVARMARRRAIVRHLPAVEALGSTTVICSDKTGTLTENRMRVRALWLGGETFSTPVDLAATPLLRELLLAGALCNDAHLRRSGEGWLGEGDPTESALLLAAEEAGLAHGALRLLFPRLDELPFAAERQAMATLHEIEGERLLFAKGAVERLLPACSLMLGGDGALRVTDAAAVDAAAAEMASAGLRVLLLARKGHAAGELADSHLTAGLTLLGLIGMQDPPRARAIAAVRACHAAGIRVKMITGDHGQTALAIARQLGIADAQSRALGGRELAALDEAELAVAAATVDVFARVEPEQKLRLVRALQANGELVAMTGDGVNDAPALKSADIGVAMGLAGTEVAKEAADIVLTDDNFATLEAAVEEGRAIYDNLVKFIAWTLPTNFGEGLVIVAAVVAGATLPITPLQILWINMTTAVLLGLPLAFEPKEAGIMRRLPRPPQAPVLDAMLIWRVVLVGVLMLIGSFTAFEWALAAGRSEAEARTLAVNLFVMVEIFYLFNCRSLERPIWQLGWFSNLWVWFGVGAMALLQIAFTYLPTMQRLFATAALTASDWLAIFVYGALCATIVGLEKQWRRRRRSKRSLSR